MASINTDNLEIFYERLSQGKDKYAFFLGGVSDKENYETAAGDRNTWEDVSVLYHVRKQDAKPVVRRINYVRKKSYDPWRSTGNSTSDNFYVLNETNNTVYLCVSSNDLNRSDLFGTNNSTYTPSFETGVEYTYPDGYRWRRLYKIDSNSRRFLSDNLMPVNDAVRDFDNYPTSVGLTSLATSICNGSPEASGACGLYPRTKKYDPSSDTYTTAGYLWDSFVDIHCWRCFELAENLEMDYRFVEAGTASDLPASVTLQTNLEKINANQFNPQSNEKVQAELVSYSESTDGEIISLFINLSSLSYDQRKVSTANPTVVFTSATGSGASARLITYTDSSGNNIVNGIELLDGGSGYFDYSLTIPSIANASTFTGLIEVNIEPLDGYATSVRKLLNCNQLAFKVEFDSNDIKSLGVNQTSFKTYGLLKNPETTQSVVFGSDLNKNEKKLESNITKLVVKLT
jgi:hypothetical protein